MKDTGREGEKRKSIGLSLFLALKDFQAFLKEDGFKSIPFYKGNFYQGRPRDGGV